MKYGPIVPILVAFSAGVVIFSPPRAWAIDYNSTASLCAAFDGQPLGRARGQTVAITCDLVRRVVAATAERITVPPFRMFTLAMRRQATVRFVDTLAEPKESALRKSCARDLLHFTSSYSCHLSGILIRFVLNPSGTVQRAEISISASSPEIQAEMAQAAVQTGVDQFSNAGIALSMQVYAMRCRQVSDLDEVYQTDGSILRITILNFAGS